MRTLPKPQIIRLLFHSGKLHPEDAYDRLNWFVLFLPCSAGFYAGLIGFLILENRRGLLLLQLDLSDAAFNGQP